MRIFSKLAIAFVFVSSTQAFGQSDDFQYQDGVDFETLARPVAVQDPSKIEVAEVFWYGCIHCFNLEPRLDEFASILPDDVNLVKVPAMWAGAMELHARLYFASVALGINEEVHWPVFQAMNEERNPLSSEGAILDLIENLGQDRAAFQRALNSFGVTSQVTRARSAAAAYGIRGTPEMIVNGKYRISTSMTGSQEKMLLVTAALVDRERQMAENQ
ncbi:MAG: thiol:disulfide interchange protein DsbA/DsbL [Porticoccaceae bacterium]|nr:thiol:disulfide interchange protein DsbA/DsbL [Porticoccaceae bacterium]